MEESHQHSLPSSGPPTTRGVGPGGFATNGIARAADAVLMEPDASRVSEIHPDAVLVDVVASPSLLIMVGGEVAGPEAAAEAALLTN